MSKGIEWIARTRCLCGADANRAETLATVTTDVSIQVRRCAACGLGFSTPCPSEATIGRLYADKHTVNDTNFEVVGDGLIDRLKDLQGRRQLRALVPRYERPSVRHVLDYGTGNGRFALLAQQVFPNASVDAIDYQPDAPIALRDRSGRGISYAELSDWQRRDTRYDVILLRHVLEHNHDPARLLRALRERLTPNGRLYVEVPNLDSWYVRGLGPRVNTFAVPHHLFHFSDKSLRGVIASAGLECDIGHSEMPLIGTALALLTGRSKTLAFQLAGAALHPVQLGLSAVFGAPCVTAVCRSTASHTA